MKIAILGASGMLGSAVYNYFSENTNYTLYPSYRNQSINLSCAATNAFIFEPSLYNNDWHTWNIPSDLNYIINCIGKIKPQIDKDIPEGIYINSIFPYQLANYCENVNTKLIHISSDCVYSGSLGSYDENSKHDAIDYYGKSKSFEPKNCIILRTSIIGEEVNNKYSLIEWTKAQKGKEVQGYTNHYWNGITTREYAKACYKIIANNWYKPELYHIFGSVVSKDAMLAAFDRKWNLGLKIKHVRVEPTIDRTLTTVKDLNAKLNIPSFSEMLSEI